VEVVPTPVEGCVELRLDPFEDRRGGFLKLFHKDSFEAVGLRLEIAELFVSWSATGVVRGLHFQRPPADIAKLVTCLAGEVVDAVVDLRATSPTRGRHCLVPLSKDRANAVYVPEGCAHGFFVTQGDALVAYAQSGVHEPDHEGGVLWSSAGVPWPVDVGEEGAVVLSDRDAAFPPLEQVLADAEHW